MTVEVGVVVRVDEAVADGVEVGVSVGVGLAVGVPLQVLVGVEEAVDVMVDVGVQVRLEVGGENTQVDRDILEKLDAPLTHLLRNAVDHGIEEPAQRLAAGKSAEGTLTLSAEHRAGRILIRIADDGAGINHARVLAKAIEKGLIAPDAQLSKEEVDEEDVAEVVARLNAKDLQPSFLITHRVALDDVNTAVTTLRGPTVDLDTSGEVGPGTARLEPRGKVVVEIASS